MLTAADVSAVLVTRGDLDIQPIIDSLPFDDVVVWDNSKRPDLGVYGRHAAILEAKHPVIYTQDDDVIVDCFDLLLAAYQPGVVTVNFPADWPMDIPWLNRGALYSADLPARAFSRYLAVHPFDRYFTHFICDGVMTLLLPVKAISGAHTNLPAAFSPDRISTTAGWYEERRPLLLSRCRDLGSTF